MKKENIYKLLYVISLMLLVVFFLCITADYYQYSSTLNSAPFYLWILVRAVEFMVPSIIIFIAARVIKKKLIS